MSDIETELARAVRNGLLSVTINKDWQGPNWTVTYRNTDNTTTNVISDTDPAKALMKALRGGIGQGEGSDRTRVRRRPAEVFEAPVEKSRRDFI